MAAFVIISNFSFSQATDDNEKEISEWIYCGESEGDNTLLYIRNNYITKNYSGIKIWTRVIMPTKKLKGKVYKNTIDEVLMLINCEEQTLQMLKIVTYSSTNKILDQTGDYFYKPSQNVNPNSMGEKIVNKACELFNE